MTKHCITFTLVGALIVALATVCFADTQKRVPPPQDQEKMHLSVVGDPASSGFLAIMSWFETNKQLALLRNKVHFHAVHNKPFNPVYYERYQPNIKGTPTIRLQDARGVVLYESYRDNIPKSASALASDITRKAEQVLKRPFLPWRKKMEDNCDKNCQPQVVPDEPEYPEYDDQFNFPLPEPEPEPEGISPWVVVLLALASAVGGGIGALASSLRKEAAG